MKDQFVMDENGTHWQRPATDPAALVAAIRRIDSEEAKAVEALRGVVFGEDRVAVLRALDGLSEAIRVAARLSVADGRGPA